MRLRLSNVGVWLMRLRLSNVAKPRLGWRVLRHGLAARFLIRGHALTLLSGGFPLVIALNSKLQFMVFSRASFGLPPRFL